MNQLFFVFLFVLLLISGNVYCADTAAAADSAKTNFEIDSATAARYSAIGKSKWWLSPAGKTVELDVQQYKAPSSNVYVFLLLTLMLGALTYLKIAFNKNIEELVQSVFNQNLSQQILRTRSKEITFSAVLLNVNFVIAIGLYVRFVLVRYFHVSSLEGLQSILLIIFLFTFFYVAKVATLSFIGAMFDAVDACEEYIYNFTTACKTLGLALIPALFIFYTAPEKFFNFIFGATILVFVVLVAIVAWRGLSTGYKLMYRSVYHFFIYVCVVEISPIFLLFKLLTKTII